MMNIGWLIAIIVAIVVIDVAVLIWWKSNTKGRILNVLNFVELRRNTDMNIFGVIFIGLILNILMLPLALFYWLHLACTWHPKKRERI